MNRVAAVICLFFANFAIADCESTLTEAHAALKKGNAYAARSAEKLNQMQDMIRTDATNTEICTAAQDTRMGAFLAAKRYKSSRSSFLSAVSECPSPYDAQAAENADAMTAYYNKNAELVGVYDKLIVNNCAGNALAPTL